MASRKIWGKEKERVEITGWWKRRIIETKENWWRGRERDRDRGKKRGEVEKIENALWQYKRKRYLKNNQGSYVINRKVVDRGVKIQTENKTAKKEMKIGSDEWSWSASQRVSHTVF